jgi:hypothetical protein
VTRDQLRRAGRLLGERLGSEAAHRFGGVPISIPTGGVPGALVGTFARRGQDIELDAALAREALRQRAAAQRRDPRGRFTGAAS